MSIQKATFGAGCFWGIEEAFRLQKGVQATRVGYMGGTTENPRYEDVCTGKTGHIEVVEVTFDEENVFYEELLALFWSVHDPTQVDGQGVDIGTQYRSVIFYHTDEQHAIAKNSYEGLSHSGRFQNPLATEIRKVGIFYEAEEYHQHYIQKHGGGVCAF